MRYMVKMDTALFLGSSVAALTLCAARVSKKRGPSPPLSSRFGDAIRSHFYLDFDKYVLLNHGSYGTAPKAVMEDALEKAIMVERFPDDFFRRKALGMYSEVCDRVCAMVGGEPGSVVLVENATTAVNTVLLSLTLNPGDVLVINDNTYNACKLAVMEIARRADAVVEVITLPIAVKDATEISEIFDLQIRKISKLHGKDVAFVLLDAISSPTALLMPLEAMIRSCRAVGAKVMVDGAHAPGQFNLGLQDLKVDWYTGNLHKWCFTMKGCAFLYTAPKFQAQQQSIVISHFAHRQYTDRFYMQGTNDQSRYLSIPAAFRFIDETLGGMEAMRAYNQRLASDAAAMLAARWGTQVLVPDHLCAPFLRVIQTPLDFRFFLSALQSSEGRACAGLSATASASDVDLATALRLAADDGKMNEAVAQAIFVASGIQGQFFFWVVNGVGVIFCRISAQVYNKLKDFEALADAVLTLTAATGAYRPSLST